MHFKDYICTLPAYKPVQLTGLQTAEVVKLSSNENALGPSPRAMGTIQAAYHTIHLYPDGGTAALRTALSQRANLPAEMTIVSNGSDEMVLLLCLGFLREGDDAVMAQGTFISYLMRTLEMGANAVRIPLRHYTHDLLALAEAITPRTRLVFVCNPNNPTGTTVGAAEVEALLARVPDDVLVVVDEAYLEYATRRDFPDLLVELRNGRRNLILLRTFSKIYGLAGLRVGYAYAHPDVIVYLNRVRPVFNVNALAQVAALAALEDDIHVARSRAHAAESRVFFEHALTSLGLRPIPTETNFIAVDVGDDTAVSSGLREHGFTVTPLAGWGVPGCIRITFGTPAQNEQFMVALSDVLARMPTIR